MPTTPFGHNPIPPRLSMQLCRHDSETIDTILTRFHSDFTAIPIRRRHNP